MTDEDVVVKEPLWFWRRVAATIIDCAWITFAVVFLVWLFFGPMSDHVRASGLGFTWRHCDQIAPSAAVVSAANAAWPNRNWNAAILCEVTSYGLAKDRFVEVIEVIRKDNVTTRFGVTVHIDAKNNVVYPISANWAALGLIIFTFAIFPATRMMASPGLYLMRRKIVHIDGSPLSISQAVVRMLASLVPFLLAAVIAAVVLWRGFAGDISLFTFLLSIAAIAAMHMLWWKPEWIGYGQRRAAIHDLWCGTEVRPRRDNRLGA